MCISNPILYNLFSFLSTATKYRIYTPDAALTDSGPIGTSNF